MKARASMMRPTKNSKIFQEMGLAKMGAKNLAREPSVKKKQNEARLAPTPNIKFASLNLVETEPIRIMVSR